MWKDVCVCDLGAGFVCVYPQSAVTLILEATCTCGKGGEKTLRWDEDAPPAFYAMPIPVVVNGNGVWEEDAHHDVQREAHPEGVLHVVEGCKVCAGSNSPPAVG